MRGRVGGVRGGGLGELPLKEGGEGWGRCLLAGRNQTCGGCVVFFLGPSKCLLFGGSP